jgi:hypothetical protein
VYKKEHGKQQHEIKLNTGGLLDMLTDRATMSINEASI